MEGIYFTMSLVLKASGENFYHSSSVCLGYGVKVKDHFGRRFCFFFFCGNYEEEITKENEMIKFSSREEEVFRC